MEARLRPQLLARWYTGQAHSFRIVHHASASPRWSKSGCYGPETDDRCDVHLDTVAGLEKLHRLIALLDNGDPFSPAKDDAAE